MADEIIGALGKDKAYLFMDNAGFHQHEDVIKRLKKGNIEVVFNVAYHYDFNPVEKCWR